MVEAGTKTADSKRLGSASRVCPRHEEALDSRYDSMGSFSTYINSLLPQAIVERIHARLYDSNREYADNEPMRRTVDKLEKMITDYPERGGAKLLRSKLMWLVGKMYGAKEGEMMLPAIAVELSQNAILIVDDIEDGALIRREGEALHHKYGTNNAINVSQYMNKETWLALDEYSEKYGAGKGKRVRELFNKYADRALFGQTLELEFSDLDTLTKDTCEMLLSSKTAGYSTAAPAVMGAIIAGKGHEVLDTLEAIGIQVGMSFQLRDDINDIEEDAYKGTPTLLIYKAYREATVEERSKLRAIYSEVNTRRKEGYLDARLEESNFDYVMEIMEKYDSIGYARAEKERYFAAARELYFGNQNIIPDNKYSKLIISLLYEYVNGTAGSGTIA